MMKLTPLIWRIYCYGIPEDSNTLNDRVPKTATTSNQHGLNWSTQTPILEFDKSSGCWKSGKSISGSIIWNNSAWLTLWKTRTRWGRQRLTKGSLHHQASEPAIGWRHILLYKRVESAKPVISQNYYIKWPLAASFSYECRRRLRMQFQQSVEV